MLSRAANSATPSSTLTAQTLAEWRSSLAGARTNVRGAIVSLSTAKSRVNDAAHNLKITERELTLARAGATAEQLAAQESLVAASRARANRIRAQLAKTILRSPISGIVTVQDAHVGEIASAGTPLITVMELGALEIEANVPEITIGEVTVGDPITATFDTFPSERFTETVAAIDPAATVVDGVVNYRVTVSLDTYDERLRSGLTANLLINAVTRENTLSLPASAITETNLGTFVRRISSSGITDVPVTIGLHGTDGSVEITSGLAEFDTVVKTANYLGSR
jgi:RND family efflux transporter MFP subunit